MTGLTARKTLSYSNSISRLFSLIELECDIIPIFYLNKTILIKNWNYLKSLAAGLMLALSLTVFPGCGPEETGSDQAAEALATAEESRLKAAEAKAMAEETKQIVDEAYDRAEKARDEAWLRQKESEVQSAVQMTALAMTAHLVETGAYTNNYDRLKQFGWLPHPNLIYGDLLISQTIDGQPNFKVTIRHQDPEPRAFMYDQASGRGVEPAETSPQDQTAAARAPASANRPAMDRDEASIKLGQALSGNKYYGQERAAQTALQQLAIALQSYKYDKGALTANYDDLLPYGWRADPDLIYGEIKLTRTPDGEPGFEVIVRHKDPGPRVFKYNTIGGVQPAN